MDEGFRGEKIERSFNSDSFYTFWTKALQLPQYAMFFLCREDSVVGIISGGIGPDPLTGVVMGCEMSWRVSEDGRGGGMALLKSFEEWAKENGATRLAVHGRADKGQVQRLTQKLREQDYVISGFQYIKEI
jgi:GNAT superfamily N-acetyltransferase